MIVVFVDNTIVWKQLISCLLQFNETICGLKDSILNYFLLYQWVSRFAKSDMTLQVGWLLANEDTMF